MWKYRRLNRALLASIDGVELYSEGTIVLENATIIYKRDIDRAWKLCSIYNVHPSTGKCSIGIKHHEPNMDHGLTFYTIFTAAYSVKWDDTMYTLGEFIAYVHRILPEECHYVNQRA